MSGFYPYLIPSLPALYFGTETTLSLELFFSLCADWLTPQELKLLQDSVGTDFLACAVSNPLLKQWHSYNIALNNELVKLRAGYLHVEAQKFLRPDGYSGFELAHLGVSAHRNPSLIESEKMLDQARWNFLEELAAGHFFDLEALLVYAQKLRILERWRKINTAAKEALVEAVLTKG